MDVRPEVSIRVNGVKFTHRQIQVLQAVQEYGSQKGASEALGISVPVLHRQLNRMESSGVKLLYRSPSGTTLTQEAKAIVQEFSALNARLGHRNLVVACSIITEELLLKVLSPLDRDEDVDLVIADDRRNVRDFQAGLVDVLVLDDPTYLDQMGDVDWDVVAEDELVHVYRGPRYLRFRYGAQRIGYRHLGLIGADFELIGETRSLAELLDSGLSFFANASYLARKGISMRSATPGEQLRHIITAVRRRGEPGNKVVQELVKHWQDDLPL